MIAGEMYVSDFIEYIHLPMNELFGKRHVYLP